MVHLKLLYPPRGLAAALGLVCLLQSAAGLAGAAYVPANDEVVLERLPAQRDPAVRNLRRLRARLLTQPADAGLAAAYARRAIEQGRRSGDPRYAGYAASALARWNQPQQAPIEIAWLQAVLQQHGHDFSGALLALDALLARSDYAPARLTRASLLGVVGRPQEALRDCAALARSALVTATVCAANAGSLSGRAAAGLQAIDAIRPRIGPAPDEQLWVLTAAAEIAARLEQADAGSRFELALAAMDQSGQDDPYLLATYADFMLDQKQPQPVIERLRDWQRVDSLLLRLILAEQSLGLPAFKDHQRALQARFDAARERGDTTHSREEALFVLRVLKQAPQALKLAQTNWATQREPLDARLLLESAIAAGDAQAAQPVLNWMKATAIEDPLLHRLAARVGART